MNYVQPAFKVAQELKDAWSAMPKDKDRFFNSSILNSYRYIKS